MPKSALQEGMGKSIPEADLKREAQEEMGVELTSLLESREYNRESAVEMCKNARNIEELSRGLDALESSKGGVTELSFEIPITETAGLHPIIEHVFDRAGWSVESSGNRLTFVDGFNNDDSLYLEDIETGERTELDSREAFEYEYPEPESDVPYGVGYWAHVKVRGVKSMGEYFKDGITKATSSTWSGRNTEVTVGDGVVSFRFSTKRPSISYLRDVVLGSTLHAGENSTSLGISNVEISVQDTPEY